mgnify:FL=1
MQIARVTTLGLDFMLENPASHMTLTIEAPGISAAANAVITIDVADPAWAAVPAVLVVGGMISIDGTGWDSLDGKAHRITAVSADVSVTIATSTATETGLADLADITVKILAFDHVCLSEFTPNVGAPGEVDATTMCDLERVNLPGLSSPGTASITGMFNLDDEGMLAMLAAQADALPRFLMAETRQGQRGIFHGVVSMFAMGGLAVEGMVTYVGSFTMDRSATYAKAA